MLSINVVMVLVTLISPAHADEQNATVQTDTAPIENPPLPPPKPSLLDATGDNPAVLISAFRHQHGEDSVVINAALTRVAQEQANAMAMHDLLDHDALAPFSSRIGRSGLSTPPILLRLALHRWRIRIFYFQPKRRAAGHALLALQAAFPCK